MAPDPVVDWLLESDPSIRWQVFRDVTAESAETIAAERARVANEGFGRRLLELQMPDGQWGGGTYHYWDSTTYTLLLLRDLGIDPDADDVRRAVALVRDNVKWEGELPRDAEWHGNPFFSGETEVCINGMVLMLGSYFGETDDRLVEWLLEHQLDDGGWNCEAPPSVVTSIDTTISVLEGLLEYERSIGGSGQLAEVRGRAHEYLLTRRMFRSLSTGEVIDPNWLLFSFPTRWPYDVLRGLDYMRSAGVEPEYRMAEALELVEAARGEDDRWLLHDPYPGAYHFDIDDGVGRASRWITLRARRVLDWGERSG